MCAPPTLPQWHAYGHGIRNLANAVAQAADGIALYYNSEAAEVIDAATAAGTAVPPMLRILPASFNQAVDAVQVGMSIEVRGAALPGQSRGTAWARHKQHGTTLAACRSWHCLLVVDELTG